MHGGADDGNTHNSTSSNLGRSAREHRGPNRMQLHWATHRLELYVKLTIEVQNGNPNSSYV